MGPEGSTGWSKQQGPMGEGMEGLNTRRVGETQAGQCYRSLKCEGGCGRSGIREVARGQIVEG